MWQLVGPTQKKAAKGVIVCARYKTVNIDIDASDGDGDGDGDICHSSDAMQPHLCCFYSGLKLFSTALMIIIMIMMMNKKRKVQLYPTSLNLASFV